MNGRPCFRAFFCLLRNRKIKTEIRQFYCAFVCRFFGKKRVLCVLPYLLQIGDFFRTAGFVFGRSLFFSRTMPLSCESPSATWWDRGRGSTGQNLSHSRTNLGFKLNGQSWFTYHELTIFHYKYSTNQISILCTKVAI